MTDLPNSERGMIRRNGVWWYRRRVPHDLISVLKKREIKCSLKTRDLLEANVRRNRRASEIDELFRVSRLGRRALPAEEQSMIIQHLHKASHSTLAAFRSTSADHVDDNSFMREADDIRHEAATRAEWYKNPDHPMTLQDSQMLAREVLGLDAQSFNTANRSDLRELTRRSLLEHEKRTLAYLYNGTVDAHFDSKFLAPTQAPITLQQMAEEYLAEHAKTKVGSKRKKMLRAAVEVVLEFFGPKTLVSQIKQSHCREFRDLLNTLPSNMRKHFPDKTVGLAEIAIEAASRKLPLMKHPTQDKYIHTLKVVMEWACENGHLAVNPANKTKAMGEHTPAKEARYPFEVEELNKIFKTCFYTDEREQTMREHPSRYWTPLIALFSGMRQNEICQLDVDDIQVSPLGNPYFEIVDDLDGKRVKNSLSKRRVPLHSELEKLGLLKFTEARRRDGNRKLFPDVKLSDDGYFSRAISRWANGRLLVKAGVKRPGLVFHSFRHTVKDAVDSQSISHFFVDAIGGWKTTLKGASVVYGKGPGVDALVEHVEKIRYPGLDLRHLHAEEMSGDEIKR